MPGVEVDRLEHLLLLLDREVEIGGDDVGERAGVGDRRLIAATVSCGTCGRSSSASIAWRCRLMKRASISGWVGLRHLAIRSTRATRKGQPCRNSTTRKRCSPWETTWCVPSGRGDVAHDLATVPMR